MDDNVIIKNIQRGEFMKHLSARLFPLFFALPLLGAENLLRNPGFENSSSWRKPPYWSGEFTILSPGLEGKSCGRLKALPQKKIYYGRCFQAVRIAAPWGRRFRYELMARGTGELRLGYLEYTTDEQGKSVARYIYSEPFLLNQAQWEKMGMDILSTAGNLIRIAPLIEIRGENACAFLDNASLRESPSPGVRLSASPAHLVVKEGDAIPAVTFLLMKNENEMPGAELHLYRNHIQQKVFTDRHGYFSATPGEDGTLCVSAVHYGVARILYTDRVSSAQWMKTDGIAKKIKLHKPLSILYLGDSLSDFERGRNYADKVDFWLNLHNPGKAVFRNASVRGDSITRVRQRMLYGKAFRQEEYDNLFHTHYDYIFLFLGHNDTRCLSSGNYDTPLVPPAEQKKAYLEVIRHIRQCRQGKIVLVSPASSNFDVCRKAAEKQKTLNKIHNLYGQPEKLEAFDAVLRQLAAEENVDYLDVYTPMKHAPDKSKLFSPTDGVHLTEPGNRFLTDLFLRYFSTQQMDRNVQTRSCP